jgi:predicted secreted protein
MAVISGHGGVITEGGSNTNVANLRSWSVEQTQDTIETTVMNGDYDTAVSRTYVAGPHTWTMTADIFYDATETGMTDLQDAASSLSAVAVKLYPEDDDASTYYYTGNVIVTSFSVTTSVDGMVEASISAQGTGALAWQNT